MTLSDSLYEAINNNINLDRLLLASGIDKDTFFIKLDLNQFTHDERTALKAELKDWEAGK